MLGWDEGFSILSFEVLRIRTLAFFKGEFSIDPAAEDAVAFAHGVKFGILLDAVPTVVFEHAELVLIPKKVVAVFALHFGVVTIEANRGLAIFAAFKETACRPAVQTVTGPTSPTGLTVGASVPLFLPFVVFEVGGEEDVGIDLESFVRVEREYSCGEEEGNESLALEIESGNDLGCEGASALLTEDLVVEFRFRLNHLAGAGRGLDGEGFEFGEVIRAELHWQKY